MLEPQIYIPTRVEIESLKEGDLAPDCFGHWRRVTRIYAGGNDINGKAYVYYYTEFGVNGSISNSLKEGQINRTITLTAKYSSHELDVLEEAVLVPNSITRPPEEGSSQAKSCRTSFSA
jgi:hypothetical protein